MKKIALILLSLLMIITLVSCNKDSANNNEVNKDDPTLNITELFEVPYQYDLTPYIDITEEDYIGVTIDKLEVEITDEDINNAVYEDLAQYAEYVDVTDGTAEMGDSLNINFTGSVDGIEFDGGKAENYEMILGQAGFIPGFEEAIVGHANGEEFVIDVTFPEDYGSEDLNGKEAQFAIKINSLKREDLPELTEDFVKEKYDCNSMEEYLNKVREDVTATKSLEVQDQTKSLAFDAVYANVVITDYPEKEYKFYHDDFVSYYEEIAKSYYGVDLKTYITDVANSTEDEFYYYAEQNAEVVVAQELIFFAIANQQKLWQDLTKADYDEHLNMLASLYEMDDTSFEEQYGSDDIWKSLIWEKAINFVVDNAVITEKAEEPVTEQVPTESENTETEVTE